MSKTLDFRNFHHVYNLQNRLEEDGFVSFCKEVGESLNGAALGVFAIESIEESRGMKGNNLKWKIQEQWVMTERNRRYIQCQISEY